MMKHGFILITFFLGAHAAPSWHSVLLHPAAGVTSLVGAGSSLLLQKYAHTSMPQNKFQKIITHYPKALRYTGIALAAYGTGVLVHALYKKWCSLAVGHSSVLQSAQHKTLHDWGKIMYKELNFLGSALVALLPISGEWIEQRYPDTLLAVLKFENKKSYQFKVKQQIGLECGWHSERNCLYMMDMLNNPRDSYKTIYDTMINTYDDFIKAVGCERKVVRGVRLLDIPGLVQQGLLPKNSEQYKENIFNFTLLKPSNKGLEAQSITKEQKADLADFMKNEGLINQDEINDAVAVVLYSKFSVLDIEKLLTLTSQDQCCVGFNMTVTMGENAEHRVSCIVNKKGEGNAELFFADSMNKSLESYEYKENYLNALKAVIRFALSPRLFCNALIRLNSYYIERLHKNNYDEIRLHALILCKIHNKAIYDLYKPFVQDKLKEIKKSLDVSALSEKKQKQWHNIFTTLL